jgi:hypothetical protein
VSHPSNLSDLQGCYLKLNVFWPGSSFIKKFASVPDPFLNIDPSSILNYDFKDLFVAFSF